MSFASVIKSPQLIAVYGEPSSNFYAQGWEGIPSPSAAHTPSVWYELYSALPCDVEGLVLYSWANDNQYNRYVAYDVAIGSSGNEVIIAEGILGQQKQYYTYAGEAYLPLRIQKGQRVAVRIQWGSYDNTSYNASVRVMFIPRSGTHPTGFVKCTTVGFDRETTTGTDLSLGNIWENWGAAVQISSGVPYRVRAIATSWHSNTQIQTCKVRIHSGASGRGIVPVILLGNSGPSLLGAGGAIRYYGPYPVDIPPNTPLYMQQIGVGNVGGYFLRTAIHLFS